MSVICKVKKEALDASWHYSPYTGGFGWNAPSNTFADLVTMAFDDVSKTMNHARHCSMEEMYRPALGQFRQRKEYSSLAPSLCIPHNSRLWKADRGPYSVHNSYKPKQGEWLVEKVFFSSLAHFSQHLKASLCTGQKPSVQCATRNSAARVPLHLRARSSPQTILHLPTKTTRFENHFLYALGKRRGAYTSAPFFNYDDYAPMEQRRYHRLFWASDFIGLLPSCRHARQLMLSAY